MTDPTMCTWNAGGCETFAVRGIVLTRRMHDADAGDPLPMCATCARLFAGERGSYRHHFAHDEPIDLDDGAGFRRRIQETRARNTARGRRPGLLGDGTPT